MKPLMLIPPAQAEALYDAQEEGQVGDRSAPTPWLDDDSQDEDARSKSAVSNDPLNRYPRHRLRTA